MLILNLGCGRKTSQHDDIINIDWSLYLRLKSHKLASVFALLVLRGDRLQRFQELPDNILVHNLRKGIPFGNDTVDVVYHSHMLEHLDRSDAEGFLREAFRVLKPGGIHRIVVPDMEQLARNYLKSLDDCRQAPDELACRTHDLKLGSLIEQSVRRQAAASETQGPFQRYVEGILLGDARRRGETHQWMYDEVSLKQKLLDSGYKSAERLDYNESLVPGWETFGLDTDVAGGPYKSGSLYVEATK